MLCDASAWDRIDVGKQLTGSERGLKALDTQLKYFISDPRAARWARG